MLTARRSDGGHRDEAWEWIRNRWTQQSDIPITVGYDEGDHPFNRSKALNAAAREAGDWDLAVISDADSFCGFDQIDKAIASAAETGLHTIAFTRFCYLTRQGSRRVMDGFNGSWEHLIQWKFTGGCSSMLAVPRSVWDAVGGMDEGFEGWGEEDVAFSLACQTMCPSRYVQRGESIEQLRAGFNRLPGDCWHLWHPVSTTNDPNLPGYKANVARRERYVAAAHDRAAMSDLLHQLGLLG